ncbi:MAG: hypothetical protein IPO92_14790 [Saprospiraceae bacterium]|nr:hypothetical protein [Saprospiraceae bacterium]
MSFGLKQLQKTNFLWNTGYNGWGIDGLEPGLYSVTGSHDQCTKTKDFNLPSDDFNVFIDEFENAENGCPSGTNGYIHLGSDQDNLPINYIWNTGETTSSIDGLGAGTYTVTATLGPCEKILTVAICTCNGCIMSHEVDRPRTCPSHSAGFSEQIIKASTSNSLDGAITITPFETTQTNFTYSWTGITGQSISQNFESNMQNLTNLKTGLYTLKVNDGCKIFEETYFVPFIKDCSNSDFNVLITNTPCFGGHIAVKTVNSTGLVLITASNGFSSIIPSGQIVLIPTNLTTGTFYVNATDMITSCNSTASVEVSNNIGTSFTVDIPIKSVTGCKIWSSGSALGTFSGGTSPISGRWWLNGNIVSNSAGLLWNKTGLYTYEAWDACGLIATKSIQLSCDCDEFPVILQYNKCWDECGWGESDCSKLKLAVNCNASGTFTVIWPDNKETMVTDCKIKRGPRYFKPKNPGSYDVKIISSTGCIKDINFLFQEENWCLAEVVKDDFGNAIGVRETKGHCDEDKHINPASPVKLVKLISTDFLNPCSKVLIRTWILWWGRYKENFK